MSSQTVNGQDARCALLARYDAVRGWSESFARPLEPEDCVVQSMPDASPTKWHLAHTSWFFETFVLKPNVLGYQSLHPQYDYLFNSYYNSVGERHCRPKRGLVSRPTVSEVFQYRAYVDEHMRRFVEGMTDAQWDAVEPVVTLGLHHEQQHQELMVTDIKHVFSENPLAPAYLAPTPPFGHPSPPALADPEGGSGEGPVTTAQVWANESETQWIAFEEGLREIGDDGRNGFIFDNEGPRHREFVPAFQLASRLVTNREWLAFMEDGGYERPEFWLSEGWGVIQRENWKAPLYWWKKRGTDWHEFTLSGMRPLDLDEPVCHVSLFEADAYAQWVGARLPTEAEWEIASQSIPVCGSFVETEAFHPTPAKPNVTGELGQMYGEVWQWTRSQYTPYPGFKTLPGALGEYNGKFMCNQFVLRGGSCATSQTHIRPTYRNFFPPDARWQFTGLRLAKDIEIHA